MCETHAHIKPASTFRNRRHNTTLVEVEATTTTKKPQQRLSIVACFEYTHGTYIYVFHIHPLYVYVFLSLCLCVYLLDVREQHTHDAHAKDIWSKEHACIFITDWQSRRITLYNFYIQLKTSLLLFIFIQGSTSVYMSLVKVCIVTTLIVYFIYKYIRCE